MNMEPGDTKAKPRNLLFVFADQMPVLGNWDDYLADLCHNAQ